MNKTKLKQPGAVETLTTGIPKGWSVKKIKDITNAIFSGGTPDTRNEEFWDGDIPWLSSGETGNRFICETDKTITQKGVDYSSTRLACKGDIVVASAGQGYTRGQAAYCLIGTYINQSIVALRADETKIDSKFLFYYISSQYKQLRQISDGHSSRGSLTTKLLADLDVKFPQELREQRAIAKILSDLDDKIELNHQMNKTLESIAQTIFKQWFVEFEFPGYEKAKFVNGLPEGWGEGCLGDILEVSIGGDWGNDDEFEGATQAISLRGTDLEALKSSGYANNAPIRWVRKDKLGKRTIKNCDILIGGSGLGPIGKSIYCSEHLSGLYRLPVTYSNFCKRLIAKMPAFAAFAEIILENMYVSGEMKQFYTGTSIPNLDVNSLLKYPLVIPAADIISKFYAIITQRFSKLFNKENILLAQIRDSLLPRLISGRLRVNI